MLRARQYQDMRNGYDFIAYRLRSVEPASGDRRHELYVKITHSGLRRQYRHARFNRAGVVDVGMRIQETSGCPESRIGPPCDTRLVLTVPLSEQLLHAHADAGLQVTLVTEDEEENKLALDAAYIAAYLDGP
ncbi:hypothetical protein D6C00_06205 [Thiohalobacter thiocyanaticus]|uniref:Uncharacterized protein n=2 Tax=Thiohalobacter thiocyanaticus TaxID=585455 RepID=A0A426QII3_9GAMM|nr:hypothetical protein D6C00_06205 [Thiohalobacter thiocyanaticus]